MCLAAFMSLGILCREHAWLAGTLIGVSGALLLVNTALFSQWYWPGFRDSHDRIDRPRRVT